MRHLKRLCVCVCVCVCVFCLYVCVFCLCVCSVCVCACMHVCVYVCVCVWRYFAASAIFPIPIVMCVGLKLGLHTHAISANWLMLENSINILPSMGHSFIILPWWYTHWCAGSLQCCCHWWSFANYLCRSAGLICPLSNIFAGTWWHLVHPAMGQQVLEAVNTKLQNMRESVCVCVCVCSSGNPLHYYVLWVQRKVDR